MRGEAANEAETVPLYEIPVLRCNWRAVQAFRRCKLAYISGGMGAHCLGIEASELQAVLTMTGEPRRRWPVLSRQVLEMGAAAAGYINDRAREEAERAKDRKP